MWAPLNNAVGVISQSRQLQLRMSLQELQKKDKFVSQYLREARLLCDELTVARRPISISEFNVIIFKNLGQEIHPTITVHNLKIV